MTTRLFSALYLDADVSKKLARTLRGGGVKKIRVKAGDKVEARAGVGGD